ncbi:MAG: 2-amino-4-hydroxy-6-hydroxymethyldihydropteridine diphosphokinase [Sandaracinaceae bacterium]|nr:2-amino-4-hydroxy-6-hydroxymethyldihydropteridine diphosphokinase [Sandaracinaceae bacterium]
MTAVIVGLGSNLGDRERMLTSALDLLTKESTLRLVATSAIYETTAVGPEQPDFLNAAARFETTLSPHEVLAILLRTEAALGRVRREKWGPRTIDLDILWMQDTSLADATLTIPHPQLMERPFALAPLVDVAKELTWAQVRCEQLGGIPRKIGFLSRS